MNKNLQTILVITAIGGAAYGGYQLFFAGKPELILPDEPEISWDVPRKLKEVKLKKLKPVEVAPKPVAVEEKPVPVTVDEYVQEDAVAVVSEPAPEVSLAQDNTKYAMALKDGAKALEGEDLEGAKQHLELAAQSSDNKTKEEATSGLIMLSLMGDNLEDAKKYVASVDPATVEMGQSLNAVVAYHMSQGDEDALNKFVDTIATKNPNLEPQVIGSLLSANLTAQKGDVESARAMIDAASAKAQAAGNKELAEHAQNAHSGIFLLEGQKALLEEQDPAKAEKLFDQAVSNATGEAAQALKQIVDVMKMQMQMMQEPAAE